MNDSFTVFGLPTGIIHTGDPMAERVIAAAGRICGGFYDGDILVLAETAVATSEGNVIRLSEITPSAHARVLAEQYRMNAAVTEVVHRESESIVVAIPGILNCMKDGTLLPNAGVDASNAPTGCVTPLPADPNASARTIKQAVERATGARIGVIIADSRTHAMRLGCSGVAIGCAGIPSVIVER
jgi:coenzyme F420-0:L-glutamate ligase